jgi:hypothetical protein
MDGRVKPGHDEYDMRVSRPFEAFLTMPDGQISIWLSSPSRKNISLNPSGKSLI